MIVAFCVFIGVFTYIGFSIENRLEDILHEIRMWRKG